uniref:C-type lectin domain-containing protein n=1 Tax=Timema poppense TaxID=170557 RepID=A0A7R9DQ99_TIMPO|nr:unnamed protein product [Timema poppensis]
MLGLVAQTRASFQLVRDVGYYKYHTNKATWQEAQDTCRREDSNLVLVNTPQEMEVIGEIMHRHGVRYVYSGFHDLFLHGQYVTVFGDLLSKCCLEEWEEGALSPSPAYNCGSVSKEHKLAVQDCSKKLPFICENPLWFDYEYFPGVGYYKLFTSGENWVGAHKRCTLDGAHLAVINSETEADVFRQLLARFPTLNNTDHDHRALVGFHAIYDTTSPDDCKKFYTVHVRGPSPGWCVVVRNGGEERGRPVQPCSADNSAIRPDTIAWFTYKPVTRRLLQVQLHYFINVTKTRGPAENKTIHEKRYVVTFSQCFSGSAKNYAIKLQT